MIKDWKAPSLHQDEITRLVKMGIVIRTKNGWRFNGSFLKEWSFTEDQALIWFAGYRSNNPPPWHWHVSYP